MKTCSSNPFYRGVVVYKGREMPGRYEAIVTPELWDSVAAARKQRRGAGAVYRQHTAGTSSRASRDVSAVENGSGPTEPSAAHTTATPRSCAASTALADPFASRISIVRWKASSRDWFWREEIVTLAGQDVGESIDSRRERLEARRRRLVRMYADDMMSDAEYSREKLELAALMSSLVQAPNLRRSTRPRTSKI